MAKMKVHELAKELNIQSKDIIAFLQNNGIEVKAAQSSMEENAVEMVKQKFAAAAKAEAAKTEESAKADSSKEEEKPEAKAEEAAPKKKKKIIFVSNPQNSKMPGSQRPPASSGRPAPMTKPAASMASQSGQSKPTVARTKPAVAQEAETKPVQPTAEKTVAVPKVQPEKQVEKQEVEKPIAEQPVVEKPVIEKPAVEKPAVEKPVIEKPMEKEPESTAAEEKPAVKPIQPESQGKTRSYNNDRPQGGTRPYNGDRPQSGSKPYGNDRPQGGARSYNNDRQQGGNRPYNNDRTQGGNRYGDRPQGGNRPYNNDRFQGGNRSEGGRPGYGNGQGDRRNSSQGGSRPYNNDRFGKGNDGDNRFRKAAPGKTFVPEGSVKENEKHRDEEKRRMNQEKDKRSKKDLIYEEDDKAGKRKKAGLFIKPEKKKEDVIEEKIKVITLPEVITIKELAEKMKLQPSAIVKKLFMEGRIVTVNQEISYEDAENIAIEYDIICEKEVKVDVIEELLKEEEEDEASMTSRPPVICVMGHVDHGKTSLLDSIRKTNVTDREAGGITQHIGAYTVSVNGQKIAFLDTPGHEAFTAMRMRGANATDIAILVVAADDGVMPQTVEAINHAKAAGVEIIVAVNKIDKPNANVDRVKQELAEYELIPEDWGGSTIFVPVSAKSGEGIEQLLEMILLTADILELKANAKRRARGIVIEAELDKGRGPVATVLVQKGTLKVGDFISAGASHGKVRAMIDDKGRRAKEAGPSTPVEILGLSDVPSAGEVFIAHENDKTAKSYAETYMAQNKEKMLEDTKSKMSLDDLFSQIQEGNLKELNLIIKADVQGSVEAVKQSLLKLSNEEVIVKCIHGGVGAITESDVTLASTSQAIIIGFNVRPDATAKTIADREGVDVRLYKVIYQAIEDVEAAMKGMLDPVFEEKVIGHAEVRQIFKASAVGNIAGSYVMDGVFQRGCKVRVSREGKQIFEGELASLKRFKDDVKEVKAGYECGLVFEGFDQMQELDIVEAYIMVEVPR